MALYPTKEEILEPYEVSEDEKDIVKDWIKKCYNGKWKGYSKHDKNHYLLILINNLEKLCNNSVDACTGEKYGFMPGGNFIVIDRNNPSILSTLHEFGHALHGSSELEACRWSVHLFMTCFPKAYSKLIWKGHMLIKSNAK